MTYVILLQLSIPNLPPTLGGINDPTNQPCAGFIVLHRIHRQPLRLRPWRPTWPRTSRCRTPIRQMSPRMNPWSHRRRTCRRNW